MKKIIEIKNLNYTYPDGKKALEDINIDVFEQESVGIIGPNGAGKTTLLLHLNGILVNNSYVKIFDTLLDKKNLREIRRKVGLLFQNPDDQLFMPVVFDEIAFGLLNIGLNSIEIEKRIKTSLSSVGLTGYENRTSHHLSYGEKKLVALATVLAMEPEILILDEPTSNLDPATRREFIELINNFNHTKIIAGHDMDMIKALCQRIIVINNGRKVAEGPTLDIFGNKELLKNNRLL